MYPQIYPRLKPVTTYHIHRMACDSKSHCTRSSNLHSKLVRSIFNTAIPRNSYHTISKIWFRRSHKGACLFR